ncbi:MAG TPA: hypothetical protein VEQ58_13280, partial [Polyangiaceae bacterium]|nr:hypothetical protein [Polyangiaceae bacterium]
DVAALGPHAQQQLLRLGATSLLGLRELCGFEPLLAVKSALLAVPTTDAGQNPDFALIAETTLAPEPALRCAEAAIRKRGGTPARTKWGAFEAVHDSAKPLGEVAIRKDGLFVLSGGQYFKDVIGAASGARVGDEPARLRSALHDSVRRELGAEQLRLSSLSGAELPFPGVKAFGIGLDLERETLRGALYCPSAADCQQAAQALKRLLALAASEPDLATLATVKVEQREAKLEVTGRLTLEQLGHLATLLAP